MPVEPGNIVEEADAFVEIEGAQALIDWLGFVPTFHDARLTEIELISSRSGRLRLEAFRRTDQTDETGHFILDRHAFVTLTLNDISTVRLEHFAKVGIVNRLRITNAGKRYRLQWDSSYGAEGCITAGNLCINFEPSHSDRAGGDAA